MSETEPPSYAPTTDAELHEMVRALTGYADAPDELTAQMLDRQVRLAKLRMATRVDADEGEWFRDGALGQALIGCTAIMAKAEVENYSVSSWSVGDQQIRVNEATQEESSQFQLFNEILNEGLRNSDATASYTLRNTTDYIGGHGH